MSKTMIVICPYCKHRNDTMDAVEENNFFAVLNALNVANYSRKTNVNGRKLK